MINEVNVPQGKICCLRRKIQYQKIPKRSGCLFDEAYLAVLQFTNSTVFRDHA